MADNNPWIGVLSVALGGALALLGSSISAVIKHFSDLHQKKLDRKFRLEDEDRQRLAIEQADRQHKRDQVGREIDEFVLLNMAIYTAASPTDMVDALEHLKQWITQHAHWLRLPQFLLFASEFLSDDFFRTLRFVGVNEFTAHAKKVVDALDAMSGPKELRESFLSDLLKH